MKKSAFVMALALLCLLLSPTAYDSWKWVLSKWGLKLRLEISLSVCGGDALPLGLIYDVIHAKVSVSRSLYHLLSCCLTKRTMGRGRGKGKKQTLIASREDHGSGEEEKIPVKRRGRPQKTLKDEIEEEEAEKIEGEEEKEGGNTKSSGSNKAMKSEGAVENGRKRKRSSEVNKNPESVKEENGVGTKTTNGSIKSVGFRQNGSRRKNKPRRAAEVGVECS
ncbi:hypothetical protein RJ639_042680 [Escallonia herrerae]|uniref:Uncharacterized protein n=1 Tax=Escallonia herrerae TaxID=1293975 RepID=A0AA88W9D5_9ASTE|nr:hypothetical protein RJ639_042680 [Escallonia herrerae]